MMSVRSGSAAKRFIQMLMVVGLAGLLTACAGMEERSDRSRTYGSTLQDADTRPSEGGEIDLGGDDADSEENVFEDSETFPGTGVFIDEGRIEDRAPPPGEDGEITLNFEGQGIQEVVNAILGQLFQENYVISPGVSGEVTFATAKPIQRDQIMPVLEMLLRWNGATLIWREGQYHVIPIAEAVRGNLVPRFDSANSAIGYEVLVVPLEYISPVKMAEILEPYAREDAVFNADNARGLLFLAGTRFELSNYLQIVETFDVDWLAGMSVGMFSLERIDVETLLPELQAVFGEEGETPLAGMFRFMPLERLNAIMVITPNEHYLDEAEKWIQRLDRSGAEAGSRLYVYRVKNLEADVLAGYLGDIFGTSGSSRPRRENRGNLAPGMDPASVSSVGDFQRNQSGGSEGGASRSQTRGTSGGMQLGEDGAVRITAVIENNSLLIQASPSEYDAILSAIRRLDEEPLQVLIEAQVLVVTLNDALNYGVNWFIANTNPGASTTDPGDDGGTEPPPTGTSRDDDFAQLDGEGILSTITRRAVDRTFVTATVSALESVSDVRTISSPSLMVRNNADATINVGQQLPVQSTRFVSGGVDNGGTIGNVQFINTGVILEVTPRVNPGGLVYLTLRQEVSTPGDPGVGGNPTVDTRTISTEVAIQSGQTILLGGLIQETTTDTRAGVPFLSRIPILGNLFGTTTESINRAETIVMITPTVISSTDRLQEISDEFRQEFQGLQPLPNTEPVGDTGL
ncbi:MAG: type II secretion system secretin GspD [Pseudomonadota bacterium]